MHCCVLPLKKNTQSLMSTWENLDDTTFDEEREMYANLCLMADTTSEESKSKQEKVDFNDPESLK